MSKLNKCPVCGNIPNVEEFMLSSIDRDTYDEGHYIVPKMVMCKNCNTFLPYQYLTESDAINSWNEYTDAYLIPYCRFEEYLYNKEE